MNVLHLDKRFLGGEIGDKARCILAGVLERRSCLYSPLTLDCWVEGGGTDSIAFLQAWWREALVDTPPGQ
jgi:hypothetical protein